MISTLYNSGQVNLRLRGGGSSLLLALVLSLAGCQKSVPEIMAQGDEYVKAERYADAAIQYRKAIQLEQNNAEAHHQLAIAEWKQKNGTGAWQALQQAAAVGGKSPEILKLQLEVGTAAMLNRPNPPARLVEDIHRIADTLLVTEPKSFGGMKAKAYLAVLAGNEPEALEWFQKAREVRPDDEEILLSLVQALYRNDRADNASALGKETLGRKPKFVAMYNIVYRYHMAAGRKAEALNLVKLRIAALPTDPDGYIQLAGYWAEAGDSSQEKAVIDQLLSKATEMPSAWLKVGDYYLVRGQGKEAARIYGEGAKTNPKDRNTSLGLQAAALASAGEFAEAEKKYSELLTGDPANGDLVASRAVVQMSMKEKDKLNAAIADLQSFLAKSPDTPRAQVALGNAFLLAGKRSEAIEQWEKVGRGSPEFVTARIALAQQALEAGRWEALQGHAQAALSAESDNADALILKAQALQGLGKMEEAEAVLESVGTRSPLTRRSIDLNLALIAIGKRQLSKAEGLIMRHASGRERDIRWIEAAAELAIAKRQPNVAMSVLQQAVNQNPDNLPLRRIYAQTALRLRQPSIAVEQYRRIVAAAPNRVDPRRALTEALWSAGMVAEAEREAAATVKLAPENASVQADLGLILQLTERHAEAEPVLREATRLEPLNGKYWNNLAWSQVRLKKLKEARDSIAQARRLRAADLDVLDTYGWILLQSGQTHEAVDIFRDLTTKQPTNPGFHYHLAEALSIAGDKSAAEGARRAAGRLSKTVPAECTELKM